MLINEIFASMLSKLFLLWKRNSQKKCVFFFFFLFFKLRTLLFVSGKVSTSFTLSNRVLRNTTTQQVRDSVYVEASTQLMTE